MPHPHAMTPPAIAIITPNMLMGLGFKTLMAELLPMAEICVFSKFEDFSQEETDRFVHYFVAVQTFLHHQAFFQAHPHRTILLSHGNTLSFPEMHHVDIYSSEEKLVRDILRLRHNIDRPEHRMCAHSTPPTTLSQREIEVLSLIAHGLMNKEIAQRLNISLTTVISHRKNIMEKLSIKSVAGLTLYAASLGYVDANDI